MKRGRLASPRANQFDVLAADRGLFAAMIGYFVVLLLSGCMCVYDRVQELTVLPLSILLSGAWGRAASGYGFADQLGFDIEHDTDMALFMLAEILNHGLPGGDGAVVRYVHPIGQDHRDRDLARDRPCIYPCTVRLNRISRVMEVERPLRMPYSPRHGVKSSTRSLTVRPGVGCGLQVVSA